MKNTSSNRITLCLLLGGFVYVQYHSLLPSFSTIYLQSTISSSQKLDDVLLLNHLVAGYASVNNSSSTNRSYIPALVEDYVLDHAQVLGYETAINNPSGCAMWTQPNASIHYNVLQQYMKELQQYSDWVKHFPPMEVDLREQLRHASGPGLDSGDGGAVATTAKEQVCSQLQPTDGGGGVDRFFAGSGQVSFTRHGGYVEPLLPPMRHPQLCFNFRPSLMNMEYMVHDFYHMCQQLQPSSRTIFLDMGASLDFHGKEDSPTMYLTHIFRKFGLVMDHIYAFEITPTAPLDVFQKLPVEWMSSYHWINVAVNPTPGHAMNPLSSIISKFQPEDLVIVKLDVDTPSVEMPIAYQILQNYSHLVDVLFFEHHVHLGELKNYWRSSMNGTIADSLRLFRSFREKGIAAHFWP